MAIIEADEDKWESKMYDLSCGLYFYFMNEQMEGWSVKDNYIIDKKNLLSRV